jgi:hypothetical protein
MSVPFGSLLPFSERSHHELNLYSVPGPVLWCPLVIGLPLSAPARVACGRKANKVRISLSRSLAPPCSP